MESNFVFTPLVFVSTPFGPEPRAIRLLKVLPAGGDGLIRCTLVNTGLGDGDNYTAISYVWGSDMATCGISIDGRGFLVRQNLFTFLQFAQHEHSNQLLWIDAVCIDQGSSEEKSMQIPLISGIFERATRTIAWLGQSISKFEGGPQTDPNMQANGTLALALTGGSKTLIARAVVAGLLNRNDIIKSLNRLLQHDYWTRLWIVPEIAWSRDLKLYWEGYKVPFHSCFLSNLASVMEQVYEEDTRIASAIAQFPVFRHLKRDQAGRWKRHFFNYDSCLYPYALAYRHHLCTNLRDHVFAVVGLPDNEPDLRADYSDDYSAVFANLLLVKRCSVGPTEDEFAALALTLGLGESPYRDFEFDIIEKDLIRPRILQSTGSESYQFRSCQDCQSPANESSMEPSTSILLGIPSINVYFTAYESPYEEKTFWIKSAARMEYIDQSIQGQADVLAIVHKIPCSLPGHGKVKCMTTKTNKVTVTGGARECLQLLRIASFAGAYKDHTQKDYGYIDDTAKPMHKRFIWNKVFELTKSDRYDGVQIRDRLLEENRRLVAN